MELVILAVWALCVWWAASLAGSKGRSPLLGGVLGFFFVLLGVLIVALLPTNRRAVFEREEQWREERAVARDAVPSKAPATPALSRGQGLQLTIGLGAGALGLVLLASRLV